MDLFGAGSSSPVDVLFLAFVLVDLLAVVSAAIVADLDLLESSVAVSSICFCSCNFEREKNLARKMLFLALNMYYYPII